MTRPRRIQAADLRRMKRQAKQRHAQDPGNPAQALCGKPFVSRPGTVNCKMCRAFEEETREFAARKAEAIAMKKGLPRQQDYAAAERRHLLVRLGGRAPGVIDCFEEGRMPSRQKCGGGWRRL